MTAEQYLLNNRVEVFGEYGDTSQMEEFAKAMQEYTRIKCKELLEIVAEKAKMAETYYNYVDKKYVTEIIQEKEFKGEQEIIFIDKNSILNAVDLETFCS